MARKGLRRHLVISFDPTYFKIQYLSARGGIQNKRMLHGVTSAEYIGHGTPLYC